MNGLRVRLSVAVTWLQCTVCRVAPINRRALMRWTQQAAGPDTSVREMAGITWDTVQRIRSYLR